jgi:hypothetical protein
MRVSRRLVRSNMLSGKQHGAEPVFFAYHIVPKGGHTGQALERGTCNAPEIVAAKRHVPGGDCLSRRSPAQDLFGTDFITPARRPGERDDGGDTNNGDDGDDETSPIPEISGQKSYHHRTIVPEPTYEDSAARSEGMLIQQVEDFGIGQARRLGCVLGESSRRLTYL